MEDFIPIILDILKEYGYLIVFLGAIIGGEVFILASAFLASLGYFNIFGVIAVSTAGIIISDSVWYFIGLKSHRLVTGFRQNNFLFKKFKSGLFDKYFHSHYGKFLILSKFIYGTRTATLLASGYKKVAYKRFLMFNLIGIGIWIVIIIALGYVMGFSWHYLKQYNFYFRYFVLFGILLLFIIRFIFNKLLKQKNVTRG